ncbi:MAG: cytochrome c3 family protein [Chlorobiaceae bacterium]
MHLTITAGCAECHNTNKWKPASFNHRKLSTSNQCLECHKSDKPNDKLHLTITAGCTECHNTNKWKPASFNHNKYFKLDRDHSASCAKCHTDPNNYKTYTCYNCHEHSPSKIAAEHRKERISNYQNCIKCHRSSSEREREHEGRGNDD